MNECVTNSGALPSFIEPKDWYQTADFAEWRGHRIPVLRGGKAGAPRLLLIHGFPTASWDWHKVWPGLAADFELMAFDLIGFGWAAKPIDYRYSLMDQTDLTEHIVGQAGWVDCHLLAHDYGDSVAQELLARQSEQTLSFTVDRCVLLNGGIIPGVHRPTLTQKLLMTPLGPWLAKRLNQRKLGKIFRRIFGPKSQPSDDEIGACWQLIEASNGQAIAHKLIRYMAERVTYRDRWVSVLSQPPVPIRLIDGMADPISGAHLVTAYRELAPTADVIELDKIGHYPQLEAPQRVLDAVRQFCSGAQ